MSGCYLYGVTSADASVPEGLSGLDDAQVRSVTHRGLAAVVSDLPERPLGKRVDLLAHERVVEAIAASAAMLPGRFAGAVESESALIERILEPHCEQLTSALQSLAGHRQYTLRGDYDVDAVLREILAEDERIRQLRTRIGGRDPESSYAQQIRQGELVVQALQRRRSVDAEQFQQQLRRHVAAAAPRDPGRPEEVLNCSFLVKDAARADFETAVERLGEQHDGRIRLRLLGPVPPYDFVPGV